MARPPLNAFCEKTKPYASNIIFEDNFDRHDLDAKKWLPYYLPHWSGLGAAARFNIADSILRLTIANDQQPWCPEFDGQIRVSGLQTGHFAGPLDSSQGQHRFNDNLRVRHTLPEMRLFVPQYCRLEMKACAKLNPWNLAALWLIGFEDAPEKSGEITVFEAFGDKAGISASSINRGIKKIQDPTLVDEIDGRALPINIEDWHVYAMDWTPSGVDFYVDGERVTTTTQSPAYPMQIMLNFYDLSGLGAREAAKEAWFDIDYIRAYGSAS
ncbi:glycoside hydrolase family 16 protein [Agrobacterium sp. 22-226-1]